MFGTDGRLKLFNSSFAGVWRLSRRALAEHPTSTRSSSRRACCTTTSATWGRISRAVTSFSDHREPLEGQMIRPDGSVIDFTAMPLPDGATLLTFVDVTAFQALRARPARAQRGAGGQRPAQEPVHRPRLLRAEDAADQHHRLLGAAVEPAHRRAQLQAARLSRRHPLLVQDPAGDHRRHPRSRHHRCRRAGAEAGDGRRPCPHRLPP